MSSYRSYAPWKSSLPTSYKSGSTSAYSSRDDISSRYGSLASPSTYRPSFSGGTYRIKRDPVPTTSTVSTPYVSRYASVTTAKDPIKSNDSSATKPGSTSKYSTVSSSATSKDSTQVKRYGTSNSNLPKYGHSREPSPAALERTNRIKSRESSPLARTLRGKSRDPSPAIDTKCKLGYGAGSSYRMSSTPRATSTGYSSRYGSTLTTSRAASSNMLDKSISYLSVSDFRARSISRAREIYSRKSNEKELEDTITTESDAIEVREAEEVETAEKESDSDSSGEETFISVAVVTRATSPTLPGSTTVQRTRRMDIAKTIEKTINRSTRKKKMLEKEIQSDRMDDPTRYSRFGLSSRVSSYSPHSEGRYTSSNSLRYSASPLSTTSKSTSHNSEVKKEETPKRSPSTETKLTKSKLSPPKAVRQLNSRQSSVENLTATNANKSLPPTAPKADSPTKTASTATIATVKWPNKDFRKSALNVGPTDRPRKSRTPSTGTESDGTTPLRQRQERSPSACSEGSNASAGNNKKSSETKIRQRCHPKTGSALGRQNSSTSLKSNAHKSCHPTASTLMSSSTSTCSSSGTESANEHNKTNKPKKTINKKKAANTLSTEVINTNEPKRTTPHTDNAAIVATSASNSTASDKNSSDSQPPPVSTNKLRSNNTEDNTQIPVNKNTVNDQTDRAESSQLKSSPKSTHSPLANPQKKATCRLQKLSSVSNFFAARQNDTNSEPIFFESSESSTELDIHLIGSNSLTKEFETNTSPAKIANEKTLATTTNTALAIESVTDTSAIPKIDFYAHLENSAERSDSNPPCTETSNTKSNSSSRSKSKTKSKSKSSSPSTTSNQTASSTNLPTTDLQTETPITFTSTSTEQEEPSWWQDTSRQINTSSALDFNPKDEMRYRLRHIDSGEVGWWLRNDEDDTLADDDIKTLNQEDEDASEATGRAQSLPITQSCGNSGSRDVNGNVASNTKNNWWVSETNDDNDNNNDNDHADVETQKHESEQDQIDSECEEWNLGQKREQQRAQTEENQCWNDSKQGTHASENDFLYKHPSTKQNGSIQLKICRVESGERPWWLSEENQATVEATIKLPVKERGSKTPNSNGQQLERSPSNNNNLTGETHWWMSGPTKKLFNVQRVDSGEKAWWQQEDERESTKSKSSPVQQQVVQIAATLRHSDSGEQAWWLQDNDNTQNITAHQDLPNGSYVSKPLKIKAYQHDDVDDEAEHAENGDIEVEHIINYNNNATHHFGTYSNSNSNSHLNDSLNYEYVERPPPLGHRASPDGLEDPMRQRKSPYDNIPMIKVHPHQAHQQQQQSDLAHSEESHNKQSREKLFISRHKNIDELLGGSCRPLSPLFFEGNSFPAAAAGRNLFLEEITPDQVRIHDSTAQMPIIQRMERDEWDYNATAAASAARSAPAFEQRMLDDAAIQVYKDGDYGAYLDLESSLAEQAEEIEGLNSSRKNSLVVRTQLSVRVHAIIEKLLSAEGSDLRRALFSLKQVFQEDKDLVHAFVALGGLNCLVRVGNGADQNYQNYILRALGQVMLYVDGMNGVMKHEPTMQWLYSLIASKYRSVVKTALKLLLVFVEYVETNCYLLVNAIHIVDKAQGTLPWSNIMRLLKDYDNADAELVIYATSLINKTLAGLTDQDSFYDESDLLEQQGMESVINRYMSKQGTDIDLLDQLQLYEAVLKFEDGEADGLRLPNNSMRKTQRYRQNGNDTVERRKSRRHSTGASPAANTVNNKVIPSPKRGMPMHGVLDEDSSGSANSNDLSNGGVFQEQKTNHASVDVTPGIRRRRERAERHKSFLKEQQEAAANGFYTAFEKREDMESESENGDRKMLLQLQRDHTVKDLTQKLSNIPTSPTHAAEMLQNRIVGDMSGLISKAKEGLAKSKSKGEISRSSSVDQEIKKPEPKKSENELHWEELVRSMMRPLNLCDLDFTDLNSDDEKDVLAPRGLGGGIPPPPPPIGVPPPMMPAHIVCPPPMLSQHMSNMLPPPMFSYSNQGPSSLTNSLNSSINGDIGSTATIKKNKKTVKLFWKEVREDMIPIAVGKTIWDELPTSNVDTQKLEHLFESRAKDLITKKQQELNKSKEVIVLDHKRSNAINIAMTKLPPPRAIKAAILKMDATVVTREGIDKLLNMLPTDEERGKIQEAQMANPELPLGSAEQFLLTLASISELAARLKLWAFRLDFDNSEKEIAEPLMDLKQGIDILRKNRTFKCILSTLLSVGIFLNGAPVKGFQIEYLAKVPEVKDTVQKHSLLHHLCHMVMETSSETTDLYSEIGPITRASKADFADLTHNLNQLETECKASWDRLKLIAKHDCPPQLKQKLVDFLADCAERIIILQIVHRRVINRYRKFLLWLGVPQHSVAESKPNEFCRILSEFALEYRTTRERVQQQIEKKANHRERNKTRGKMIIDIGKFKTKEDRADAELKELLGTPSPGTVDGTLTWRRRRAEQLRSPIARQSEENFTDGDDEILESLVKTATKAPGTRTTPRERKRTRHADRKSLKRSRTREGFTVERAPSP